MTLLVLLVLLNIVLFVLYSRNLPPPPATNVVIPRAGRVPREFLDGTWEQADGRVYE
jgi:hypothetical protein